MPTFITPTIFTPMHEEEYSLDKPCSELSLTKLARNNNFLADLLPPGMILTVNLNQLGFTPLDGTVWQICNGSEITQPQSPLRTIGINQRFVPDIADRYIRCAPNASANGTGGTHTFNVGHSHGGNTGSWCPPNQHDDDKDAAVPNGDCHSHTISQGLGDIDVDYPKWLKVAGYMKLR